MSFQATYNKFLGFVKNEKIIKLLEYIFLISFVIIPSFFIYKYYIKKRESKAELFLAESLVEYNKAIQLELQGSTDKSIKLAWDNAQAIFQLGQEKNSSASLADYMGVFNAQALARLGKTEDAIKVLKKSLKNIDCSLYTDIYNTFEALIIIESGDSFGYEKLKALAFDLNNSQKAMAAYFLGCYELSIGNKDQAILAFTSVGAAIESQDTTSAWKSLAQDQLAELLNN